MLLFLFISLQYTAVLRFFQKRKLYFRCSLVNALASLRLINLFPNMRARIHLLIKLKILFMLLSQSK